MSNTKFINALERKPQVCPPIWLMRQAGRYHDHYQSLKKDHTFEELCKNPNLAAETAMGPINEFDFDVAILFSDILFPCLLYTSPSPRDRQKSRMPSSA